MKALHLPADYRDLLRALQAAQAEYLLIGGWAVAVHGHGRATDDMDLLVRATPANAARVMAALLAFGAPIEAHQITEGLFHSPGYGYRIGRKPLQIELLTTIDGVSFDDCLVEALLVRVGDQHIPVIGLEALLRNKRASGRHKDLADVEALTAGG